MPKLLVTLLAIVLLLAVWPASPILAFILALAVLAAVAITLD